MVWVRVEMGKWGEVVWVRVVTCGDLCRLVRNCGKWVGGIVACWRVGERETGGKGGRV